MWFKKMWVCDVMADDKVAARQWIPAFAGMTKEKRG
jgi:hypothetical protein